MKIRTLFVNRKDNEELFIYECDDFPSIIPVPNVGDYIGFLETNHFRVEAVIHHYSNVLCQTTIYFSSI